MPHELIDGCIANDRRTQQKLYELTCGRMYAICLRYAGSPEDAEDILQLGYLRIFKNIQTYKGYGNFEGWLTRVMINTACEHIKARQKMKFVYPEPELESFAHAAFTMPEHIEARQLMEVITSLPDRLRIVFNLYAIEGYSHAEIAAMLEITEGASKALLFRCREKLKKLVNDYR